MTLQIYDTMTRVKRAFEPLDPGNVRVYVCGPTVYELAHIGNARPVVVFDVLFRLLRHRYGPAQVTYARNITDIDDKIIKAAQESGEPIESLTARTTKAFHADMAALGTLEPSIEPRATQHIPQMIALIERLIERGHAYSADGHVLFSVPSMADYGKLSRHSQDELIDGARVEVAPYKRDATDFVLWKPSTEDQPYWDSPWGRGRPGWHIECSAMSAHHLGRAFDIHGGGQDLIFPHHENEIAQSRCAHPEAGFARYWMHNGYVVAGAEKMSKSLGNFFTVRQLLDEGWPGEVIRLALLTAHYRQPLDFTRDKLKESRAQLHRLYGALRGDSEKLDYSGPTQVDEFVQNALENDLNTPDALHYLHLQAGEVYKTSEPFLKLHHKKSLRKSAWLLGLLQDDPEDWFKRTATVVALGSALERDTALPVTPISGSGNLQAGPATVSAAGTVSPSEEWIDEQITARTAARQAKDFAEADRIRGELAGQGIVLEDGPEGTTWRRAR